MLDSQLKYCIKPSNLIVTNHSLMKRGVLRIPEMSLYLKDNCVSFLGSNFKEFLNELTACKNLFCVINSISFAFCKIKS